MTWSAIERTRDRILKEKLYEEWRKEWHHPCSVWTIQYFESFEIKEKEEREKFSKALDNIEKTEKGNIYYKSSNKFFKNKISFKDVTIILMLILLIYFIAVRNITISIFILIVLTLIVVIFR
jgi:hypothetical protein